MAPKNDWSTSTQRPQQNKSRQKSSSEKVNPSQGGDTKPRVLKGKDSRVAGGKRSTGFEEEYNAEPFLPDLPRLRPPPFGKTVQEILSEPASRNRAENDSQARFPPDKVPL